MSKPHRVPAYMLNRLSGMTKPKGLAQNERPRIVDGPNRTLALTGSFEDYMRSLPDGEVVEVDSPDEICADSILRDISARKYDDDMMSYETSLDRLINLHPNSFLCFDASTCSDGDTEICDAFDAFVIDKGINRGDYEFIWEGGYVATYYFIKKTDKSYSAGLIRPYDYVETNMGDYESLDNEHNYYIRVQLDPINRKLRHYYTKKGV